MDRAAKDPHLQKVPLPCGVPASCLARVQAVASARCPGACSCTPPRAILVFKLKKISASSACVRRSARFAARLSILPGSPGGSRASFPHDMRGVSGGQQGRTPFRDKVTAKGTAVASTGISMSIGVGSEGLPCISVSSAISTTLTWSSDFITNLALPCPSL